MKFATSSIKPGRAAAFTLAEMLAALLFMGIVIPVAVQALRIASLAGEVAVRKGEAARVAERVLNECILTTNYFQSNQRGFVVEGTREFKWTLQSEIWSQAMTNQLPLTSIGGQLGRAQPIADQWAASQVMMSLLTVLDISLFRERSGFQVKVERKLEPEIIESAKLFQALNLTRDQLIDLSILVGTDLNEGIRGIGPKTALKLVRKHGKLEELPSEYREKLPTEINTIREFYLPPPTTCSYSLEEKTVREDELYRFLCDEHSFSKEQVDTIVNRMKRAQGQRDLTEWFGRKPNEHKIP